MTEISFKEQQARAMTDKEIQIRQDGIEKQISNLKEEWHMLERVKREQA